MIINNFNYIDLLLSNSNFKRFKLEYNNNYSYKCTICNNIDILFLDNSCDNHYICISCAALKYNKINSKINCNKCKKYNKNTKLFDIFLFNKINEINEINILLLLINLCQYNIVNLLNLQNKIDDIIKNKNNKLIESNNCLKIIYKNFKKNNYKLGNNKIDDILFNNFFPLLNSIISKYIKYNNTKIVYSYIYFDELNIIKK